MGLSQSLYTGYSGLHTHQRGMDNVSHNLANANTTGYKRSEHLFSSLFTKAVNTGNLPADGERSATNPKGVGMGVTTGAILHNFTQGSRDETGNPFDCSINGNGFFLVGGRGGTALTRNGSFYIDNFVANGQRMLCAGDGLPVQGWMAQNDVVTPSQTVGNIYLPSYGDLLPGRATGEVELRGILPTNTEDGDFAGSASSSLQLSGNLSGNGMTHESRIYVPVTQTSGDTVTRKDEMQEVKVRLSFSGPVASADGSANDYAWTMTTVDWPNPGDPGVQIYPAADGGQAQAGTLSFYAAGNATSGHGAGEAVSAKVSPGSASVETVLAGPDGSLTTTSFTIPTGFSLDVSRLTHLEDAPTGDGVKTWHVDGNPAGLMARTVTIFDEYTSYRSVNGVMTPVRVAAERPNTLFFTRTGADNTGTDWSWSAGADGAGGTLRFDIHGELASAQQSGGGINYNFADIQNIAHEGQLQAVSQDGYLDGTLMEFSFDANGKIWGHYSNDVVRNLAQVAIGTVPNTSGLEGTSGTLFYPGTASGAIVVGVAGDAQGSYGLPPIGAGTISAGVLESSNVELSREFTNLIQVERGYQFSSRVITTSDEMLQTALQLVP